MAKTLQYWGTGNFQEHPYTGRIVTWTEKEKQTVDDAIATKLLASGAGFVLDNDETGEVVTSRIDPVTGVIEYSGMRAAPFRPNSLYLIGDSLTALNFTPFVISSASISSGVMTINVSVDANHYAGMVFRVANMTDASGRDLTGQYTCLTRATSTQLTCAAPAGSSNGSCILATARLYNMQLLSDSGPVNWMNILSGQKFELLGMSAGHSWTTSQIKARVDDAIDSGAQYIWVLGGTNNYSAVAAQVDIAGAVSTVTSDLKSIYASILQAGRTVIACTTPPLGSPAANSYATQAIIEGNKVIRQEARLSKGGIILVDSYAAIIDPMNAAAGSPKANYLQSDGVHWTARGAYYVGKHANTQTAAVPVLDDRVMTNADNYGVNAASTNLLDNAPWTNSGGSVTAPVTGTMPAGWQAYRNGSAAAAASVPARSDGFGYDAVLVTTPAAASDRGNIATTAGVPNARMAANTRYRFDMSVSLSGVSGSNISQLVAASYATVDGTALYIAAGMYGSSTTQPDEDWSGVIRSPYFSYSGTLTGALPLNCTAWFSASGTALTHKVGRVAVRKEF